MAIRWERAVLAAVVAVGASACASAEVPTVSDVAGAFAAGADRCALLAPAARAQVERSGPCDAAVAALPGGRVVSAQVWGDAAQVRTDADTLFLVRTPDGWRVSAAGCAPNGDLPHVCEVSGP